MKSRSPSFFDLSNRFGLGARLAPDPSVSRIFANCYVLCRDNFQALDERAGPGHEEALRELLPEAGTLVESGMSRLRIDSLPEVQKFLQGSEPLSRTAALLHAIASRLKAAKLAAFGETIFEASNGERFHVTPVPLGSIWECRTERYAMATPQDMLSSSLMFFHAGVHVTRANVSTDAGNCTIERRILSSVLRRRLAQDCLKVALCPMTTDAPVIRATSRPAKGRKTRFIVEGTRNEAGQIAFIQRVLERCQQEGVSILVLPELRVSPSIRAALVEWLLDLDGVPTLGLVVAGSWHVLDDGRYVNRCDTLGPRGEVLWSNDKLADYEISSDAVAKKPDLLALLEGSGREDIRRGSTLQIADTTIGRLTTAVCAGFFHGPAEAVMKASGANLFLVPAMSPKTGDMVTLAEQLTRYRAGTFLANCASVGGKERSFWRVPIDDKTLQDDPEKDAFRSRTAAAGEELLVWECPYNLVTDALDIL